MSEPALKPLHIINKPLAECYPEIADDENEKLLADVRKHWFGKFAIIFTGGLTALLVLLAAGFSPKIFKSLGFDMSVDGKAVVALVALVVVICITVGTLISLWVYQKSRMLITDQNVIEVNQLSLFSKKIAHLNMINVEDVSVIKKGILQTILDYGTMTIQTAGEQDNFQFNSTPDPDTYRRMVISAHEDAIQRVGQMGTVPRVMVTDNNL